MPLNKSKTEAAFKGNVREMVKAGHPVDQALAAAYRVKRGMAMGGVNFPKMLALSERGNLAQSGFMHGLTAGRSDHVPVSVKSNSYVIPADVVSGIGQGNSLAGAHALNRLFGMGPYQSGALGAPKMAKAKFADGGESPTADIAISDGEFTVPPEAVQQIGGGDMQKGHDLLDHFVKHIRSKTIKTLKKMPGPKKS